VNAAWLLILPLALDTFAVSSAIGLRRPPARVRANVTILFTAFEALMPLVGAGAGVVVGDFARGWSKWIAAAVLVGAGLLMIFGRDDERSLARLAGTAGWVQLLLGLSISIDEVAIGFSLGLLGLPILLVCIVTGLQALIACQLGLRLGHAVGERLRENAERGAGIALIVLAAITTLIG
jgi:manganese efflux pump family protein